MKLVKSKANFGTAPVFFTAISTILGAIMFLRFGYAVGSVGFIGTLGIILFAHLVTIPTGMAIAEIATNQKVKGGGEYYIISRSFGINIGASIGFALYMSQAISVAFYVIAFAEAFDPVFAFVNDTYDLDFHDKRIISVPALLILGLVILRKGADLGMKALYFVVAILFVSLTMFFAGSPSEEAAAAAIDLDRHIENPDSFFIVFAICFPAFTGMTAGVGLSGNLKNPRKSIPFGTLAATVSGMLIYIAIAYKMTVSATPEALMEDFSMGQISIWAPIIFIGLAAATISSAIGSILVAPRTLQAIAGDKVIPNAGITKWLSAGKKESGEPFNATLVTVGLALLFVSVGNVNSVAQIISMFFMVTYGAICLISFFQHFAADPAYRPDFKSKWYISLLGAILTIYLMFKMDPLYAFVAYLLMVIMYLLISGSRDDKEGMAKIFQGVIFQISRQLQVFLQKAEKDDDNWRPTVICISKDFFIRPSSFDLTRWISHRYGFGTYIHFIEGYFSKESNIKAREDLARLIKTAGQIKSNVFLDTMISPSYTSAIAQAIQLPSVSGKDINMILFEYSKHKPGNLDEIMENFKLAKSADFDVLILGSSEKGFGVKSNIHIWLTPADLENGSLMILLGYVIMGHPEWKQAQIKISAVFPESEIDSYEDELRDVIKTGRLPISARNIELITKKQDVSVKEIINQRSKDADLTIVGLRSEAVKQLETQVCEGYDDVGNILFVNAHSKKEIE